MMDNLAELLEQLRNQDKETSDYLSVVELQICATNPKIHWQCNVKPRDSRLAWGTAVSDDPALALVQALHIAMRGEETRLSESKATFHLSRPKAIGLMELFREEYPDRIAAGKVEFEPYKGWVVVLFPAPGYNLDFLLPQVEVRELNAAPKSAPPPLAYTQPSANPTPRTSAPRAPAATGTPYQAGGRAGRSGDELKAEYKGKHGKYPPREWKKAELAKILDAEEVAELAKKTPAPVAQVDSAEVEDDDDEDLM